MKTKGICITIVVVLLAIIIAYMIFMFEAFKGEFFIFAKYNPPPPPSNLNAFYPLGTITPMTQDEIDARNKQIAVSFTNAPTSSWIN
jgi:hypothetical protein